MFFFTQEAEYSYLDAFRVWGYGLLVTILNVSHDECRSGKA